MIVKHMHTHTQRHTPFSHSLMVHQCLSVLGPGLAAPCHGFYPALCAIPWMTSCVAGPVSMSPLHTGLIPVQIIVLAKVNAGSTNPWRADFVSTCRRCGQHESLPVNSIRISLAARSLGSGLDLVQIAVEIGGANERRPIPAW